MAALVHRKAGGWRPNQSPALHEFIGPTTASAASIGQRLASPEIKLTSVLQSRCCLDKGGGIGELRFSGSLSAQGRHLTGQADALSLGSADTAGCPMFLDGSLQCFLPPSPWISVIRIGQPSLRVISRSPARACPTAGVGYLTMAGVQLEPVLSFSFFPQLEQANSKALLTSVVHSLTNASKLFSFRQSFLRLNPLRFLTNTPP